MGVSNMHKQEIYFGSPGTGKSYYIKNIIQTSPDNKIFRVTIHPEYSYSDFIGQLLPEENKVNGNIEFPFKPGPFTLALKEAYSDSSKEVFLILEELSRGNVSAIFGDIFQLLDRDDFFKSHYPIRHKNIANLIPELIDDNISLPSNLNIICTVNMNDQNVFPMDTAFKRRFDWVYVSTHPVKDDLGNRYTQLNNPKLEIDGVGNSKIETTWQAFYVALNSFITNKDKGLGKNEDKQVGQFFLCFKKQDIINSHSSDPVTYQKARESINTLIKSKLLLYLWQDVQGVNTYSQARLFAKNINNYDDLYCTYGVNIVFSDVFLNDFLFPIKDNYNY